MFHVKIKEVIVVEGKSDYTLLKSFLDVEIIITNGSEISKETLELIKKANETRGVIILTDPDYPGMQIRNKINQYTNGCKNAFVEKSKAIRGKKVGIAETRKEDILQALENVVTFTNVAIGDVTYNDLYELGFVGKADSKQKREKVCSKYHLGWCNGKNFLRRINMFNITIDMIKEVIKDDYSN
ncbi:MAG: ribonuclease M5 [Bacilli bacterium]|nr:ribonuclease M5 [Bacilli bacterium]